MISSRKAQKNILRTNARERSHRTGGGCGFPPPTVGKFLNFGGQNHVIIMVPLVMRFLTLYLIRVWIKIIPYSRTHTETGSGRKKKKKKKKEKKKKKIEKKNLLKSLSPSIDLLVAH